MTLVYNIFMFIDFLLIVIFVICINYKLNKRIEKLEKQNEKFYQLFDIYSDNEIEVLQMFASKISRLEEKSILKRLKKEDKDNETK